MSDSTVVRPMLNLVCLTTPPELFLKLRILVLEIILILYFNSCATFGQNI